MIELKIDDVKVNVEEGATVLDAAELLLVDIPTLCHMKGLKPETSCMICVVKDTSTGQLIPACSSRARDGMEIDTECAEVQAARREILNLLLSEHVGDCVAPCTRICPASLDIPRMLREVERGHLDEAAWMAKRDLAIPVTLGYVCPAPCEKGCRRAQLDTAITIRSMHRTLCEENEVKLPTFPENGKKVAIIGSGPAGLASAWSLRMLGYACYVFDEKDAAGGSLRELPDEKLPKAILDAEIETLRNAGIEFQLGKPVLMHEVAEMHEGIIFAETEFSGTHFADAIYAEEHKLTVKAVGNGKAAAAKLDRFLCEKSDKAPVRFDSKIGKLRDSEVAAFAKNCSNVPQASRLPDSVPQASRLPAPAEEAARCLHCDCRKPVSCKLRKYTEQYGADPREYPADERKHIQLIGHNEAVVFEPGKCVKCGLCVRITKQSGETLGLTFMGRGFNTQIAVPFGETLKDGLKVAAQECVEACPTGALAFRDAEEVSET